MNWIYYLLEANFYLVIFYLLYYFIFRRETYYQANRAFLLLICPLSFLIPLVQLDFLKRPVPISALELTGRETVVNVWVWSDYLLAVYVLIALGMVLNLAIKIFKLIRLSANNNKTITRDYKLIETPEEKNAFSFFGYLFINPNLALKETVIHHELIHIRQKHSWDIIYLELMKAISWFNPVIYLLQGSIREIHEFIADRETAGIEGDTDVYTDFLLSNAYGIPNDNLTSAFFNKSLLKKRIIMLHQKRSGKSARLKYLLAVPLGIGLLCLSTLTFSKSYGWLAIGKSSPREISIAAPVKSTDLTNDKAIGSFQTTVTDTNKNQITKVNFPKPHKQKKTTPALKQEIAIEEPQSKTDTKVTKVKLPPPPPPAPPKKGADLMKKLPPPPPPAPPKKSADIVEKKLPPPPPPQPPVKSADMIEKNEPPVKPVKANVMIKVVPVPANN
jgi:hypothetical protein